MAPAMALLVSAQGNPWHCGTSPWPHPGSMAGSLWLLVGMHRPEHPHAEKRAASSPQPWLGFHGCRSCVCARVCLQYYRGFK